MSDSYEVRATIGADGAGIRADRFIADVLELFPRSQIDHRNVRVSIGGAAVKLARRLKEGEEIVVTYSEPEPPNITAEAIELEILFENADVVVINKPAGMVVHPAAGNWSGTLVQALLHHVSELEASFGSTPRPGIVHRLDKDTSGVIIAAKYPAALADLTAQFKEHVTNKHYLALVKGQLPHSEGLVEGAIGRDPHHRKRFAIVPAGGKDAQTAYRVLKTYGGYAFVSARPKTGRTHQIRVHLASLGCPIVGDPMYGRADRNLPAAPLALHAYQLTVTLPGESQPRTFTAPLPKAFRATLRAVSDLTSRRSDARARS